MANSLLKYAIYHLYDVDGGFGDAIPEEKLLGFADTEDEAKEYVEKYNKPQVYEKPYDELVCHALIYREIKIENLDINVNPWENDCFSECYELHDLEDSYREEDEEC